jgi:hypothetical protein
LGCFFAGFFDSRLAVFLFPMPTSLSRCMELQGGKVSCCPDRRTVASVRQLRDGLVGIVLSHPCRKERVKDGAPGSAAVPGSKVRSFGAHALTESHVSKARHGAPGSGY